MKSAIVFLALVAICHSAPLTPIEESPVGLSRPSPISPDVISDPKPEEKVVLLKDVPAENRQKRDEHQKPDSVKAREQLHHHSSQEPIQKPDSVKVLEQLHHHSSLEPLQKPDSVKANEGLHKHKRDTKEVEKPDSVKVQEQLHHHSSEEPLQKPDSVKASEGLIKHKRDIKESEKPDNVKVQEQLHHHSSELPHEKPDSVKANEGLIKHKRDTKEAEKPDSVKVQEQLHHHHSSEEPHEKPDSVKANEGLNKHKRNTKEIEKKQTPVALIGELPKGEVPQSAPSVAPPSDSVAALAGVLPETKKSKREAHHEEGHNEKTTTVVETKEKKDSQEGKDEPQRLPYNAPGLVVSPKKEKRETIQKPDSVVAREFLNYNPQRADELSARLKAEQRRQRDIPVPTEVKTTPAEAKSDSTTPPASHRPTAKPVSELFHKEAAIHKAADDDKAEE
ncbi:stress response protein NST1 isoform X2 [Drosophila ananassae]|uniref:stress response protein NST1 isoform X2 n=1 Tax=Drosophila ananassae TaxID=7217 RepID=UPI0013A5ECD8|nr:stress response protein NST1 isoform X2 [Drosophila ananassae]